MATKLQLQSEILKLRLTLLYYARIFVVESYGYETEQDAGESARSVLGYREHTRDCAYHNGIPYVDHWDDEIDGVVVDVVGVEQGTCTCGLHDDMDSEIKQIRNLLGIADEISDTSSV